MLGEKYGWNSLVSMILKLYTLKRKKKKVGAMSIKLNQFCVVSTISWETNLIEKIKSTADFDQEYMKIKEKF